MNKKPTSRSRSPNTAWLTGWNDGLDALEAEQAQTSLPATHKTTGWVAPVDWYAVPVLFNPYTGEPRDVRDVQSDPQGVLIVPPGKVEMLAAKPTVESVTDCMMNLVDRLGHEASDVDARAWEHLLVYAPKKAQATPITPVVFGGIAAREKMLRESVRNRVAEQAQAVEPVAQDWTHEAREKAGYEEGWNDCMTLFASHMKRMNNALVDKPYQASYKIKELK